jgi:hypothetical protein
MTGWEHKDMPNGIDHPPFRIPELLCPFINKREPEFATTAPAPYRLDQGAEENNIVQVSPQSDEDHTSLKLLLD